MKKALLSRTSHIRVAEPTPKVTGMGSADMTYWSHIREMIADALRYPSSALHRKEGDTIILRIKVNEKGEIQDITACSQSGSATFMWAVMQAIDRVKPFPPPSRFGLEGTSMDVEFPIRFDATSCVASSQLIRIQGF